MDSKNNVPYQTYRSKKHLRSHSSTPSVLTPDPQVSSFFAHAAPPNVTDSVAPQRLDPLAPPNLSEVAAISASNASVQLEAGAAGNISREKPKSESSIPAVAVTRQSVLGESSAPVTDNGLSVDNQLTPEAGPIALSHKARDDNRNQSDNDGDVAHAGAPSILMSPPTSTFRRISSRPRTSSENRSALARTSSAVSDVSFRRVNNSSRLRVSSDPSRVFANSQPQSISSPVTASNILQPLPVHATSTSPNLLPTTPPSQPTTPSISASESAQASRPTSTSTLASPPSTSRRSTSTLPYRPGFQPKGIYRQRTDDFIELRSSKRDNDKIEVRRLERRLEKLIQLHFPREVISEKPSPSPSSRRPLSLLDISLTKNPSDIWRDVVEARMQTSKNTVRTEEQFITPWQPDSEVSQCPHCSASFHPLTNRKHHCRLCGRVVCSLPVKVPVRKQPCSILFVVDQKTCMIEEVGEGVDYGVKRRTLSSVNGNEAEKERDDEKFLKGVRICKTCRVLLRRQQYQQEAAQTPTFVQLHDTLVRLEKEIEDNLGKFHELIVSLSTMDPSFTTSPNHVSATALRKRLLESFASYDRISKRIAQLPTTSGGSQERVQNAVLSRAAFFLQNNMVPLQSLPKLQPLPSASSSSHEVVLEEDKHLAETLQPLLEQEALLEGFIEEAKAQRKFEDAKTLKNNLEEIREEIKRVALKAGAS